MIIGNIILLQNQSGGGSSSPAMSGETSFAMTDIPGENLADNLYISYEVPEGDNLALMVYIHGWDGGGGIIGGFKTEAIEYLHENGIGILGVGMRGRNTGVGYANSGADVENNRDASAVELYDVYKSVTHFIDNVASVGKINTDKIFVYGLSGGGGNTVGLAVKIPDFFSMFIDWYGIGKYGPYETDLHPTTTSWYGDASGYYQSSIQKSVGGTVPKGFVGYNAGLSDHAYISRDHIRFIGNLLQKMYIYHAPIDAVVDVDLSDNLEDELIANGKTYVYHRDNAYDHGNFDLSTDYFNPGVFGLQWLNDAKTLTKPVMPTTGTVNVAGWYKSTQRNFEIWLHKYRKNTPQVLWSDLSRDNQGKHYAASCTYDSVAGTFQVTHILGHLTLGNLFCFISVKHNDITQWAFLAKDDVITIAPKTLNKKPRDLDYDWNVYFDFNDTDSYILDDAGKVSNALNLAGDNNNFAFQPTRASRASIVSGSLDNGVLQFNGTTGILATSVDFIQYPGEFTFAIKIDPDDTAVGDIAEGLFGRAAGGLSLFQLGTFSGKITCTLDTETGTAITSTSLPSTGPANTNLGLQTWVIKRDVNNDVFIKMKGTTTVNYNTGSGSKFGNITGTFDLRVLGSAAALTKSFGGKIYKFAAVASAISDADVTDLLDNW